MSASLARRLAREVVTRVREGSAYGHEVLASALERAQLSADERSFATRLAYGTLQTQGTLDEVIDTTHTGKRLEPRVRDALRVAIYEILFLHTEDRAAVHQGVELVKTVRPQASGLANALLRRVAEKAGGFPWGDPATAIDALARSTAHPMWLARLWVDELGYDTAAAVMKANNEPAPLYLAVNPFAGTVEEAVVALERDGAEPRMGPLPGTLIAENPAAAVRGRALSDDLVIVADAGAQFAASLVPTGPGHTIVEVGAGRGTKTLLLQAASIAAGGPSSIYAIDLHAFKSQLLVQRMAKLGVPGITTLTGDATRIETITNLAAGLSADAVFIDAPCSGLGTLRRHPEKRWRVTPDEMERLAELGQALLSSAANLVRPGGFLVYSTCTLAERENAAVVRMFLGSVQGSEFSVDSVEADTPSEWRRFITSEGFFSAWPEVGGPDGHFAARLKRVQ